MAFAPANYIKSGHSNVPKSEDKQGKNLDFYESMYHFKKMFPKFDIEVIEQILRSNDGSVDKTIDQLLLMASDCDSFQDNNNNTEYKVDLSQPTTSNSNNNQNEPAVFESRLSAESDDIYMHDLPPSYNEFMSSLSQTESRRTSCTSSTIETVVLSDTTPKNNVEFNYFDSKKTPLVVESVASKIFEPPQSEIKVQNMNFMPSTSKSSSGTVPTTSTLSNMRSRIMIGEISSDFLRIRLTGEQVKKIKTTIKKAKRNELTAIMNEKIPEEPLEKPLSVEMREKLKMFHDQSASNSWEARYLTRYDKQEREYERYEKERVQIIQDEYLARIIQNEEFLSELKQNKEFMQTLDSDVHNWESGDNRKNYSISNAELRKKLLRMSKATQAKFLKLATTYTKKAKQHALAATNLLASQVKSIEYNQNNSYKDLNGNKSPSRYQKAYKSFKSVIKGSTPNKGDFPSTSSCADNFDAIETIRNGSKAPMFDEYGYDRLKDQQASNELPKIDNFPQFSSINSQPGEFDLLSGYSYDDESDKNKDYTYDHSVYPKVKVFKPPTSHK